MHFALDNWYVNNTPLCAWCAHVCRHATFLCRSIGTAPTSETRWVNIPTVVSLCGLCLWAAFHSEASRQKQFPLICLQVVCEVSNQSSLPSTHMTATTRYMDHECTWHRFVDQARLISRKKTRSSSMNCFSISMFLEISFARTKKNFWRITGVILKSTHQPFTSLMIQMRSQWQSTKCLKVTMDRYLRWSDRIIFPLAKVRKSY